MKYIRTKDGIYGTDQPIQSERELQIKWIDDHSFETSWKTKPCEWKQADTIEELIDCYAVILEHQDRPLIVFKNEIEHYKHCLVGKVKSNNRVLAIYGSIWVGADLLSKSKINEKGELELL